MHKASAFILPLLLVLLAACTDGDRYHPLLVEADSAVICGRYALADSLLHAYDSRTDNSCNSDHAYRQLLALCRLFTDENLQEEHLILADSLCRLYDREGDYDKHAKSLLILGDIQQSFGDHPSAISSYAKAKQIAEQNQLPKEIAGWACQCLGNLYLGQRMLEECMPLYRQYYDIAVNNSDTLRMAYANYYMAKVYTIKNDVDSTILFYEQSARHARAAGAEMLQRYIIVSLCDIYMQTGHFDKAKALMPRDELNMANWAYWHAGQNHTDSAVFYFKKAIAQGDIYANSDFMHALVQLYEQNGNKEASLYWYRKLTDVQDSLRALSQAGEIRKAQARFEYNALEKKLSDAIYRNRLMQLASALVFSVLALILMIAWGMFSRYRIRREEELQHERLLLQLESEKYLRSEARLKENHERMAQIEEKMKRQDDAYQRQIHEKERQLILAENKAITALLEQDACRIVQFQQSALYRKIVESPEIKLHLSDEEWQQLIQQTDEVYNSLFGRLALFARLSDDEMRICCLVKMQLSPAKIAAVMSKSKSAISASRRRLYEKITGRKGSAPQFDQFLKDF